ncbi:MAG: carbon-nitrogen hydrolase family protein [Lachnospiraceae bacterium]|nr:carbon-nitrogen hydrolase family protein [Lachnospiraceae bacterium]
MSDRGFRIGLVQLNTGTDPVQAREQAEGLIREAKEKGAALVILPEHADVIVRREKEYGYPVPGPVSHWYSSLAKELGIYLHCGSLTEENPDDEKGRPYNTSLLFSPEGEILASYRKLHLFDVTLPDGNGVRESAGSSPGREIVVAKTELCTLGMSICYDLRFPELFRLQALEGAELLVVSANFTAATGCANWESLLRARAIENSCYVAAVNQCGEKPFFKAWGHTMLIDPWGTVVGELDGESPGLLMGTIDPELVQRTRRKLPLQENRRTDIYLLKREGEQR